jgi:hypothetical protein
VAEWLILARLLLMSANIAIFCAQFARTRVDYAGTVVAHLVAPAPSIVGHKDVNGKLGAARW